MVHQLRFVDCISCLVYQTPFSCGSVYIGPLGRYVPQCQIERIPLFLKGHPIRSPSLRCEGLPLPPMFSSTRVLSRLHDRTASEITEAFSITHRGLQFCVSSPTLALLNDKQDILKEWLLPCKGKI